MPEFSVWLRPLMTWVVWASVSVSTNDVQPTQTNSSSRSSSSSTTRSPDCFVYEIVKSNSWSAVTYKKNTKHTHTHSKKTTKQYHSIIEKGNRYAIDSLHAYASVLHSIPSCPTENNSTHTHRLNALKNASRSHITASSSSAFSRIYISYKYIHICCILNVSGDDAISLRPQFVGPESRIHSLSSRTFRYSLCTTLWTLNRGDEWRWAKRRKDTEYCRPPLPVE